MRRSLSMKLAAAYLAFGVLSFLFIALVTARITYARVLDRRVDQLRQEATLISDGAGLFYDGTGDVPEEFFSELTGLWKYTDIRIWFMNPDGTVTYDSDEASLAGTTVPDFDPADTSRPYRTGDFYGIFPQKQVSVTVPLIRDYRTTGYVVLHEPETNISRTSDALLLPTYLTFLVIYILAFIMVLMLRLFVTRPLKTITRGADEFAQGNLSHKIEVESGDEMGHLANTLNYMASELAASEEYQRRFIANVSHDFRSPLTSIRGYLTAFEDGTIPPERQGRYIRVILDETDRLAKLTESMLSINSLERDKMPLEITSFDIRKVIRSTCETFEGTCSRRGISFELTFQDEELNVRADYGRIQQVIYNLVDNAVKFSPDGSVIEIRAEKRYSSVLVSAKDHGSGIAKEDIKKIWTRFYKTDESRGKDKKGTGLGLSIVKDIMDAHHTTIDVVSTRGVGTECTFRLPAADSAGA